MLPDDFETSLNTLGYGTYTDFPTKQQFEIYFVLNQASRSLPITTETSMESSTLPRLECGGYRLL
jgi:hypothetical protein